jgi:hypothetical protein
MWPRWNVFAVRLGLVLVDLVVTTLAGVFVARAGGSVSRVFLALVMLAATIAWTRRTGRTLTVSPPPEY